MTDNELSLVQEAVLVQRYIDRMHAAYSPPYGSWAQRWIPFYCTHKDVRCTHGDEIIHRKWRRRVCRVCGRSLKGPLPDICFITGEPHGKRHGTS